MREYIHWEKWECQQNGMWRKLPSEQEESMLYKAIKFTGNTKIYGDAMREVVPLWQNSMKHFLTNPSVNKKAYIGHCAAQYAINCPEYITRKAWRFLTDKQRELADIEAWKCYLEFKRKNIKNNLQLEFNFVSLMYGNETKN